jgi:hypothetical protein
MSRSLIACAVLALALPAPADDKKPEPKGEPLDGTIMLGDKPLGGVTLTFVSKDGKTSVAVVTDEAGKYTATVPVGEYRITVTAVAGAAKPKKDEPPKKLPAIPQAYSNPNTTPLTCTVTKGKQTFDIVLKP